MPFWRAYYHLVWTTERRRPLIDEAMEARLFPYLLRKAKEMGVVIYAVNGSTDHVHLIVSIPPKWSVAQVVHRLKGASAHYLNEGGQREERFGWQRGYGVFTLGERQRAAAEAYVRRQKEHHREKTTNAWLERVEAIDVGPDAKDAAGDGAGTRVRERAPEYDYEVDGGQVENEMPF